MSVRGLLSQAALPHKRQINSAAPLVSFFAMALFPAVAWASDDGTGVVVILFVIIAAVAIYYAPTFIAFNRGHPNRWIIFAVNTFLGATGIIWLVLLIWGLRAVHISPTENDGGESGLNVFVNDETRFRVIHEKSAPAAGADVASQLVRLKGLLDSGGITAAEYEQLKKNTIQGALSH